MRFARSILFAVLIPTSAGLAADWPVAVGGNSQRNGRTPEVGPDSPAILWNVGPSAVIAQQAAAEGDTVVMARIFNLSNTQGGTDIYALDLHTGGIRWNRQLPIDFTTDWRSRVSGVRDGRVYATRAGNTNASPLYALALGSGAQLWRSTALVIESTTESVAYAENGDLITTGRRAGGGDSIVRIRAADGTTAWETPRTCPTTGGCDAAVYGDRAYFWEAGVAGPVITTVNLTSGQRLYSSPGIVGGFIQQTAPFVGPDGTIYAPRIQNNPITDFLVAFRDTGLTFEEKWRKETGFSAFGSFCVGPDGSVYHLNRSHEIERLDPDTGDVIDVSGQLSSDFYQPRMAVDSRGRLYVTNGGFSQGALLSFEADLTLRWSVPITNVNVGGPVIATNGTLVVCGVGTDVRAYRTPRCPSPGCVRGDVDRDCDVDLTDLAIVLAHFGLAGPGVDYAVGDANEDQAVDLTDLALLLVEFGSDCSQ